MGAFPVGCGGVWLSTGVSYKAINAAKSLAAVIAASIVLLAVRTAARKVAIVAGIATSVSDLRTPFQAS